MIESDARDGSKMCALTLLPTEVVGWRPNEQPPDTPWFTLNSDENVREVTNIDRFHRSQCPSILLIPFVSAALGLSTVHFERKFHASKPALQISLVITSMWIAIHLVVIKKKIIAMFAIASYWCKPNHQASLIRKSHVIQYSYLFLRIKLKSPSTV